MAIAKTSRRSLFALAAAGGLQGCAALERGPAVPRARTSDATVLGLPNERFLVLSRAGLAAMDAEFVAAGERTRRRLALRPGVPLPPINLLAVSGGGENGAFGAGLLCGWTENGTRPVFNLVTGVSTGALTAPFAYLGPAYDAKLRSVYTELSPADILESRSLLHAALFADGLADTSPLFRTISRVIDEAMLADLARAHQEGRLLLIGTTNLDAQIPVIWNIGAIAASGDARAPDLIRRVLLASASIPGAFPPVMFDVTVDGEAKQEMHVDGGAFAQAFLYPAALGEQRRARIRQGTAARQAEAYIIRNARLDPDWATVERRTLGIAGRAISTMITTSGYNDIGRMWANTQRDGIGYNLAFIGSDFTEELPSPFDQTYMRVLFNYGLAAGRRGYDWAHRPPF
ncbi:patatin-like phospholipase family protein [Neoroseomonas lacus]|uniref:Lipoprotein n=1 Tax=Neoroseomonas lacus TaxID=287609 RepID=A0A917NJU2_9PROT|nr:patatin-like phospholipase family protein [Neoroseomonas lacus]GGJ05842.1 lipoprotein [Neoroseomonas lacus]